MHAQEADDAETASWTQRQAGEVPLPDPHLEPFWLWNAKKLELQKASLLLGNPESCLTSECLTSMGTEVDIQKRSHLSEFSPLHD